LQHALILVSQCPDTALSGKLGRIVELADVVLGYPSGEESILQKLDDRPLKGNDLALELSLSEYYHEKYC
jgi:hypothetical protein